MTPASHRRSYQKTVAFFAVIGVAASAGLALVIRALATASLTGYVLGGLSATAALLVGALTWVVMVVAGGCLSLRRDALEARGLPYVSARRRERVDGGLAWITRWVARQLASARSGRLRLVPGEEVEVRPLAEILETLDDRGALEGLQFMPEMAAYCGRRFRVFRRVDKLNDWSTHTGLRRVRRTVMLDRLECDGSGHDGCQARCRLRWKEAWLRRVTVDREDPRAPTERSIQSEADLTRTTRRVADDGSTRYVCQATDMAAGTTPLRVVDPRHYVRDLVVGNTRLRPLLEGVSIGMFNWVQRRRGGVEFPNRGWAHQDKTPHAELGFAQGDLAQVRSKAEIEQTLNARFRNRGLWFDIEMMRFCGGTYRVATRVSRLIEEKSGRLLTLSNPCVVLEDVRASSEYQGFGAQNEAIFWREIWLRRTTGQRAAPALVDAGELPGGAAENAVNP